MQTTLYPTEALHEAVSRIDDAIEANRLAVVECMEASRLGDPEAGKRMNTLNQAWFQLGDARHRLTGEDPAPYRMGRT